MDASDEPNPKAANSHRAIFWLLLVLAIVTVIRIRLVNIPFERDEGEFAYGGQLLLEGVSPYQGDYNVGLKFPGTCAAYALAMWFLGQTVVAVHAAIILVTLATAIFLFLVTRRMCGDGAGVIAAGTYSLLSLSPPSLGLAAHATHFVMLPAMAGIYLLQNLDERTASIRIFFAGLLVGVALMMKQTGAIFGVFAAAWTVYCEFCAAQRNLGRLARRLGWLAAGGILPFVLTCAAITLAGDWPLFWMWSFKVVRAHSAIITFGEGMKAAAGLVAQLFMADAGLWCLAIAGLALLCFAAPPSLQRWRFFIAAFVFCSVAAVYPGWRGHYFIQMFPALGLLAGFAFYALWPMLERLKMSLSPPTVLTPVFLMAMAGPLLQWAPVYFTLTPAQVLRAIYNTNPFPEAVEVGHYLQEHCPADRTVAVLGSEPEIYFYSHRRAATGYISAYAMMEPQPYALSMQRQMIHEIEASHPEYVVFVHVPDSWLQYSDSNPLIFKWYQSYQRRRLQLVGLVEIPDQGPTRYRWFSGNPTNIQTSVQCWIGVFKAR